MRTRPKDLGTRLETRIVHQAQDAGLIAERLAEGGMYDRGDIRILTDTEWIFEVKDRMSLNLPATLEKTLLKAGTPDAGVIWRKMARKPGSERRYQDGPIIAAVELGRLLTLLREGR